jgi:hypothetical protein
MPRHSKSKVWPQNSKLSLCISPTDVILYKETDDKGCVQTNKRNWSPFKATVIRGGIKEFETHIEISENAIIWTCEINNRGRLSALTHDGKTYSNEKVTVIVHVK